MKITAVKINGMERPMGYAFSNVTVSWRVEGRLGFDSLIDPVGLSQ